LVQQNLGCFSFQCFASYTFSFQVLLTDVWLTN
jgi:hypothetical protein